MVVQLNSIILFDILAYTCSLNEFFGAGELSISYRRVAITLAPKEDLYILILSNWRPIELGYKSYC